MNKINKPIDVAQIHNIHVGLSSFIDQYFQLPTGNRISESH